MPDIKIEPLLARLHADATQVPGLEYLADASTVIVDRGVEIAALRRQVADLEDAPNLDARILRAIYQNLKSLLDWGYVAKEALTPDERVRFRAVLGRRRL